MVREEIQEVLNQRSSVLLQRNNGRAMLTQSSGVAKLRKTMLGTTSNFTATVSRPNISGCRAVANVQAVGRFARPAHEILVRMNSCPADGPIAHSAQCVYRNALFLSYMAFKGMVDGDGQPKSAERVNSIPAIFQQDWMADLTLDPTEERFVNAPFGTLSPFQRTEAGWLIERMAVLAWALDQATLPPFYEKVNGAKVSVALGIFQPDAKDRIERASLRNPDEIVMAANTYIALMWRLEGFYKDRHAIDLREKLTSKEGHLVVDGLEFADGDLAIRGLPITKVSDDIVGLTSTVVYQRFRQFRWLIGLERGESTVTAVN